MAADRVDERTPQGGFTLIEVMVAMLLTALTTIGVLGLYRIESRASAFSRRETEAAVLAQDKLEELRLEIAPSANSTGTDTPYDQIGGQYLFTRNWTVNVSSDSAVYNIQVDVTWPEDGVTRTVTVRGQRGSS